MKLRDMLQNLEESIPLLKTMEYRRMWDEKKSNEILGPIFKNKFRLYYPFGSASDTMGEVRKHIEEKGYELDDYVSGYAKKG
jgi:hypothetical protein